MLMLPGKFLSWLDKTRIWKATLFRLGYVKFGLPEFFGWLFYCRAGWLS